MRFREILSRLTLFLTCHRPQCVLCEGCKGQSQTYCLGQIIASIDGEAFTAVEPRIIENAEDSCVGDIGLEISSCFIDQSELVRFILRAGGIVIWDAPFGSPTQFPLRTVLLPAFLRG